MPTFNIPIIANYSLSSSVDKQKTVEGLKTSLAQTLGQCVQFGGKLQVDDVTGLYSMRTNENDAVELSVMLHDDHGDKYTPTFSDLEDFFPPMRLDSCKRLPRVTMQERPLTQHGDLCRRPRALQCVHAYLHPRRLHTWVSACIHLAADVSGLNIGPLIPAT